MLEVIGNVHSSCRLSDLGISVPYRQCVRLTSEQVLKSNDLKNAIKNKWVMVSRKEKSIPVALSRQTSNQVFSLSEHDIDRIANRVAEKLQKSLSQHSCSLNSEFSKITSNTPITRSVKEEELFIPTMSHIEPLQSVVEVKNETLDGDSFSKKLGAFKKAKE